jgi:DNA-binding winged helix-turn-helix (wHTH) protein
VTRSEITERIWGKDVFLDADSAVNTAIRKVRLALGDDSDQPKYIETVPDKSYRLSHRSDRASVDPKRGKGSRRLGCDGVTGRATAGHY